jgi:branched-chain amino acid transport system substrate-binding protein
MRSTIPLLSTLVVSIMAGSSIAGAQILVGLPGAYSGPLAWSGEEIEKGVQMAVSGLNAAGGLLGQEVRIITVDDYCDGEQGVVAARKLVDEGVDVVVGHMCSGAAIPASRIYADAGILMISGTATNPDLTDQGLANVFRFCGRDENQGSMAGTYLADQWKDKNIAILHDGDVYGKRLAEETRKALNGRGVTEVLFTAIEPGLVDYSDAIDMIQAASTDVLYFGGYAQDAGLLVQQLHERGDDLQFVSGDGITEAFALIAGEAADGTLFTNYLDGRYVPEAAEVLAALRAEGTEPRNAGTFLAYGATQAWAQAVERAGALDVDSVGRTLRDGEFDTIFGRVSFDDKGDVAGYEPFAWYVWQGDGSKPANLIN